MQKRRKQKTKNNHRHHHKFFSWRNLVLLVLYFFAFSFIGHWFEMLVIFITETVFGAKHYFGVFDNFLEPYWVYGFMVVFCITILRPIDVYFCKRNILFEYLVNTFFCGVVEYFSGWVLILRFGENNCWNYSDIPFNLQGQICLLNTLLFGIMATIFTRWFYPWLNKKISKNKEKK